MRPLYLKKKVDQFYQSPKQKTRVKKKKAVPPRSAKKVMLTKPKQGPIAVYNESSAQKVTGPNLVSVRSARNVPLPFVPDEKCETSFTPIEEDPPSLLLQAREQKAMKQRALNLILSQTNKAAKHFVDRMQGDTLRSRHLETEKLISQRKQKIYERGNYTLESSELQKELLSATMEASPPQDYRNPKFERTAQFSNAIFNQASHFKKQRDIEISSSFNNEPSETGPLFGGSQTLDCRDFQHRREQLEHGMALKSQFENDRELKDQARRYKIGKEKEATIHLTRAFQQHRQELAEEKFSQKREYASDLKCQIKEKRQQQIHHLVREMNTNPD